MVKTTGLRALRSGSSDPWVRFRVGLFLLIFVVTAGSLGYMLLGLEPLDAVYQTVVTVSTVGYREIGDVDGRYEIFTIFLILFGTGTALYTLGVLLETLFEGQLDDRFRRQRMQRRIDELDNHVIVCGYGQVGRAIVGEMDRAGREVVVVDRQDLDTEEIPPGVGLVTGEATDDDVLLAAGLARAETFVAALDSDADNLYVSLAARSERPDLFIVARANSSGVVTKLLRIGVNRVVNPHEIGGSRMAAMVLEPDVTDFLDVVMRDEELDLRLGETVVPVDSTLVAQSLADCALHDRAGATLVALRRQGRFITNPPAELVVEEGDVLIVLGTNDQLRSVGTLVRGR